jgi:hypothetical protein
MLGIVENSKRKRFSQENEIRRSQLITPFGTGAITDIMNRSVIVAESAFWNNKTVEENTFYDNRLLDAMNAAAFIEPPVGINQSTVAVKTFPSWYFSPSKQRDLKPIWAWRKMLSSTRDQKEFDASPFHWLYLEPGKSRRVKVKLVPVRIVCVCSAGHVQDFPWHEWVHGQQKEVSPTGIHNLKLKNIGNTGTIGDVVVVCSCGERRSLRGIFQEGKGASNFNQLGVKCHGKYGWKLKDDPEPCNEQLKPMMRNSNSLYFPNLVTSVNIPFEKNRKLEQLQSASEYKTIMRSLEEYSGISEKRDALDEKWAKPSLENIAASLYPEKDAEKRLQDVKQQIVDSLDSENIDGTKITDSEYRYEEYQVLMGEKSYRKDSHRFDIHTYNQSEFQNSSKIIDLFQQITLVNQMEVVDILKSFSRIRPIESSTILEQENSERVEQGKIDSLNIVEVSLRRDNKFVGLRNHGEGIFVALNSEKLAAWRKKISGTSFEHRILMKESSLGLNDYTQQFVDPIYYLLHTLSHLLIKELSFNSGYSSSALKERIYYGDESKGISMNGILIYTSSADSEGTLGGLVRQGLPKNFFKMVKAALEKARWCSYDPTCIESDGQGRNSLNLAACHACSLVSETSCERMNLFLDRGMLVGTLESPHEGYFDSIINS